MKNCVKHLSAMMFVFLILFAAGCGDTEGDDDKTSYTLMFDSQGGTLVSPITRTAGSSITLPTPTRSGYTFNGWFSAATGGAYCGGGGDNYTLTGNVTMYAQWTEGTVTPNNNYTLTFNSQGGTSVSPITQAAGTNINLPSTSRNGYTFNGWYSAASGGIKYDSPYTLTGNITMYAQWVAVDDGTGKDGDVTMINGIECVLVKAGTFTMGSPTNESGRDSDETQHQVTLTQDYYISKYPITNAQYGKTVSGKEYHPVVDVTWTEADAWAQSIGGRLPTEAEWEFAARGGNKSQGYIYSGSNTIENVAWYYDNSGYATHTVGDKQANELGIYDMSGNVYEWCGDWYGAYPTNAVTNPTGPSTGGKRVSRGGSWYNDARGCRVAYRGDYYPFGTYLNIGFRVAFPRN